MMRKKTNSFVSLIIAVMLCFPLVSYAQADDGAADTAENVKGEITLRLSQPDKEGNITAGLYLKNVIFNAMQIGIGFNKDVLQLNVSENEKNAKTINIHDIAADDLNEEDVSFSKITAGETLDNVNGELRFAAFTITQNKGVDGSVNVASVGNEEFLFADFSFKKIADGDYGISLLSYTNGREIILAGGTHRELVFKVEAPDKDDDGDTEENSYSFFNKPKEEPEDSLTYEERRNKRIKDTVVLNINNYAAVLNGVLVYIDPDNTSVVPFIDKENDRTLVPLRFIAEGIGADVAWDETEGKITVALGDDVLIMHLNQKTYNINGDEKVMDAAPIISEDRTFVPVRFVSEALNKSVYWNSQNKIVVVSPVDNPWDETKETEQSLISSCILMMSSLVRDIIK